MDGDGKLDLAVLSGFVEVLPGDGTGGFSTAVFSGTTGGKRWMLSRSKWLVIRGRSLQKTWTPMETMRLCMPLMMDACHAVASQSSEMLVLALLSKTFRSRVAPHVASSWLISIAAKISTLPRLP